MRTLFACIACFLLSLRYRVRIVNEELLDDPAPLLILPNHQALVDPQILVAYGLKHRRTSPVVTSTFFRPPGLRQLFAYLGAVEMPLRERAEDRIDYDAIHAAIVRALTPGRAVILYPSGQLCGQGREAIFGKQSAYRIIKQLPPDVRIVGVRIRGLWGSMWSRAWTSRTPPFFWTYCKAIAYVLCNGIFFCPRRSVTLTFADLSDDLREQSEKPLEPFNRFLEDFYNADGGDRLQFLKHIAYGPPLKRTLHTRIEGSITDRQATHEVSADDIDPAVLAFVREKLSEVKGGIDPEAVDPSANLALDLHCDSLALAEIVSVIRAQYPHASTPPLSTLRTVADLCLTAQGDREEDVQLPPCALDDTAIEPRPIAVDPSRSIIDHILTVCRENPNAPFCYDALQATTTRKEFLTRAFVASHMLKRTTNQERIGLMLPALQSTGILILATYLAGRTPVMFNWTVGKAAFEHCIDTVDVDRILTARRFFETVKDQIPESLRHRFVFVEEEIKKLRWMGKLQGLLLAKCALAGVGFKHNQDPAVVRPVRQAHLDADPSATSSGPSGHSMPRQGKRGSPPSVILFTSGSEALPKAVPLTQRNILTDLHGTLEIFPIKQSETVLSFLPPFHSFGFTVTTILPMIAGVRTAFAPDPTDARALLRMLRHVRPTVMASTPTFLKLLLQASKGDDVHSLQTVVTGAEALPEEVRALFEKKTKPNTALLEGYGITECSPVVTINPPERPKAGSVGKFLPHLDCTIRDVETGEPITPAAATNKAVQSGLNVDVLGHRRPGESSEDHGMIYVRGDSVFSGYLGTSTASPFKTIDGTQYYETGDLGYIDAEGYLFLTGRLKRFLKIGGEMISLPAIETVLNEQFGDPDSEQPTLAVEGSDATDPPRIVLFATQPIDCEQANASLRERGASNLIHVDHVEMLEEIPLLGTGKIDYKVLRERITNPSP